MIASPRFHWAIVALFILKSNWNIWENYEWPMGDEAEHYSKGYRAFLDLSSLSMAWSPLNSMYFGAFAFLTGNPFLATFFHRMVIVVAVTLVYFGILRRLVPGIVAMALTFWWASIPANIAPLYTVHLFAHLANLLAIAGFLVSKTERGRGISFGLVAVSALFFRNEGVACYLFLLVTLSLYEWFRHRSGEGIGFRRFNSAYLTPSLLVLGLWLALAAQTDAGIQGSFAEIKRKSAFNFSQNYGFTYFLQHPETEGNVWYVYKEICKADFGKEIVSVSEAIRANPAAFMNHVKTNLKGVPSSLEIAFFNSRHTEQNPDVVATPVKPFAALAGLLTLCLVWVVGGWCVYREKSYFIRETFRRHFFAWLCFFGFFLQAIPVASIILSRTSFYLTGIAFLYLFTGLCVWALWRRLRWSPPGIVSSVVGLLLLQAIPSLWANRTRPYDAPRALLAAINPFSEEMKSEGMVLVASIYQSNEMHNFLDPYGRIEVKGMEFLLPVLDTAIPLGEQLKQEGAELFFACGQETVMNPNYAAFAKDPSRWGWALADSGTSGFVQWVLYRRGDE